MNVGSFSCEPRVAVLQRKVTGEPGFIHCMTRFAARSKQLNRQLFRDIHQTAKAGSIASTPTSSVYVGKSRVATSRRRVMTRPFIAIGRRWHRRSMIWYRLFTRAETMPNSHDDVHAWEHVRTVPRKRWKTAGDKTIVVCRVPLRLLIENVHLHT